MEQEHKGLKGFKKDGQLCLWSAERRGHAE